MRSVNRAAAVGAWLALIGCEVVEAERGQLDAAAFTDIREDAVPSGQVRILTYNTHLFFDTKCDSGKCSFGDFEQVPSMLQFEDRTAAISQSLYYVDADVVCLQEIENATGLLAIQAAAAPLYPTAVMGEVGGAASIDVAVLSKLPLLEVRRHRDTPLPLPGGGTTEFTRELLEVHLDGGSSSRIVVFCAHFRSKVADDPERRLAEAKAARVYVMETAAELPDSTVVLAGDLNDTPGSPPIAALEADPGLFRVASELGAGAATWGSGSDAKAIDHILLPLDREAHYVAGTAEVYRFGGKGLGGSDHAGLGALFWVERPAAPLP